MGRSAIAAVLLGVVALLGCGGDSKPDTIDRPVGRITAEIPVGDGPIAVAAGAGGLWVLNGNDGSVVKVDPARNRVVGRPIKVRGRFPLGDIAAGAGGVWVAANEGPLQRIDPARGRVAATVPGGRYRLLVAADATRAWSMAKDARGQSLRRVGPAGRGPSVELPDRAVNSLSPAADAAWLTARAPVAPDEIARATASGPRIVFRRARLKGAGENVDLNDIAVAGERGWVAATVNTNRSDQAVIPFDARTMRAAGDLVELPGRRIVLAPDIEVGAGGVWVSAHVDCDTCTRAGVLARVDPSSAQAYARPLPVCRCRRNLGSYGAIAVADGAVWVADEERDRLVRVRPSG